MLVFVPYSAAAEQWIYHEPHSGYTEVVDDENPGEYASTPGPPHEVVTKVTKAGTLTFNFTFADVTLNTNNGFDDPTDGATRRSTMAAVGTYLNDILNENSGATIDVDVRQSQTDGTGFLATAGTFWATTPNRYDAGVAHEHITTGTDPSGSIDDIHVRVDFGYTFNSDLGDPTGSEYDLFTALLHEMTHGLGFSAASFSTGTSSVSGGNPGVFTPLTDGLTRITGSVDLWNAAFTFTGIAGDLTSADVAYSGTNATAANGGTMPKIYAPGTFASGSSLSHWDFSTFPNELMRPAIAVGVQQRFFGAVDFGALEDFGYSNIAPVELATVYVDFGWTGAEDGSSSFPFDTLAEALAIVEADGTIRIAGDSSTVVTSETFSGGSAIDQSVTILADPAGSGVRIGVVSKDAIASTLEAGVEAVGDSGENLSARDALRRFLANLVASIRNTVGDENLAEDAETIQEGSVFAHGLPFTQAEDGSRTAGATAPLAVRLRSEAAIDPASIWGPLPGYTADQVTVLWQPVEEGDMRDVWIIAEPTDSWYVDELIEIGAAGQTVEGEGISSDPLRFRVDEDASEIDGVSLNESDATVPDLPGGDGSTEAWAIEPQVVFEQPQRIWLPIPAGVSPGDVALFYYHGHGEEPGWYPAENVEGWLVPESSTTTVEDGVTYFGFLVRHAGIVQLGQRQP
jgi:hypothetical protein